MLQRVVCICSFLVRLPSHAHHPVGVVDRFVPANHPRPYLPPCSSGQGPHRVKKRLGEVFREAEWCQPSVVLLDDLDHAMPHFSDAQEEAVGEGVVSVRTAQGGWWFVGVAVVM